MIVIGGGASGMMAAGTAASKGLDVILLEKNDKLGKKLFISGKGRCNITNYTNIQGLIDNIPGNGQFLYSAFNAFTNTDLIEFFNRFGVNTKVERGGRVFPSSDKSSDIIKALESYMKKNNVKINLNSEVNKISKNDDKFIVSLKNGSKFFSDKLIIATGGLTYPATGSTGDGYEFAKFFGHSITKIYPSLVPLVSSNEWIPKLQGVSLKNVSIKLQRKNKTLYEAFGEMLFTHYGVSGPIVLSASRHLVSYTLNDGNIKLIIDLKPALSEEQLDKRIQKDFQKYNKKQFSNSLDDLLPQKMIPVIVELSTINPRKNVNQITKDERLFLAKLLKNLTLDISGTRPINEGIVTCGGVSIREINPRTMESKIVGGLYFTGEVIDVDGYTGGFNLQIAFSTGYLAGLSV